ncbi:hypothetical protein A33K_16813 [Burkholderia humptydooensis MSMB43]|uniref:Uncharacterized protein n=1 Tax=Burkholderia humptydooensis MSMB43 TaxID=441157 RepID=A0ABN0G4P8_9BURK|nr:hypothetical protein A33K_16813 [Burkholderia humptydooensis MSMB43]
MPEVPCDRAILPPDLHKVRRQVTQSPYKAPRFSAMNPKKTSATPGQRSFAASARSISNGP